MLKMQISCADTNRVFFYSLSSVFADLWRRISHSRKKMIEAFHILINQVCLQPILESRYWHSGTAILASYCHCGGDSFLVFRFTAENERMLLFVLGLEPKTLAELRTLRSCTAGVSQLTLCDPELVW